MPGVSWYASPGGVFLGHSLKETLGGLLPQFLGRLEHALGRQQAGRERAQRQGLGGGGGCRGLGGGTAALARSQGPSGTAATTATRRGWESRGGVEEGKQGRREGGGVEVGVVVSRENQTVE